MLKPEVREALRLGVALCYNDYGRYYPIESCVDAPGGWRITMPAGARASWQTRVFFTRSNRIHLASSRQPQLARQARDLVNQRAATTRADAVANLLPEALRGKTSVRMNPPFNDAYDRWTGTLTVTLTAADLDNLCGPVPETPTLEGATLAS